jgi:vesicle-fusing ATPase
MMASGNSSFYLQINSGPVFLTMPHEKVQPGTLGFNQVQRKVCALSLNAELSAKVFQPPASDFLLSDVQLFVDFPNKAAQRSDEIDAQALAEHCVRNFSKQILQEGQEVVIEFLGMTIKIVVGELSVLAGSDIGGESKRAALGQLFSESHVSCEKAQGTAMKLINTSSSSAKVTIFRPNFSFETMGIGGLDKEFQDIFRRAFASRVFPGHVTAKMGIKHVRGMLLYGPPGCGKTLIARQIGKMLCGKEPKVVNGPEVLSKYVGQSEENIRALFADAEVEMRERGDDSDLHIIIFDEIDAICKSRGSKSGDSGVGDQVVNQLLSKIDGVDALNNILLIGMTNRKDLLDPALLRSGRLEVHCEIGLPDEKGRVQILTIHTAKMKANGYLHEGVSIDELAKLTKNFSGAEIEGLTKSAASYAFERTIDPQQMNKAQDTSKMKVEMQDFELALREVVPSFGASTTGLDRFISAGMVSYGDRFDVLMRTGQMLVDQVKTSSNTPLMSILLEGRLGTGKSALAATLALEADFPFVKLVSIEDMVGLREDQKAYKITQMFDDAHKSELSILVLDDIERLLEWVRVGSRFSNVILQTLLVLLKKVPPKGRRLLIIGTTSQASVLESMEMMEVFNVVLNVPTLDGGGVKRVLSQSNIMSEADTAKVIRHVEQLESGLGIKQLLMVIEMAKQRGLPIQPQTFIECLVNAGFTA